MVEAVHFPSEPGIVSSSLVFFLPLFQEQNFCGHRLGYMCIMCKKLVRLWWYKSYTDRIHLKDLQTILLCTDILGEVTARLNKEP